MSRADRIVRRSKDRAEHRRLMRRLRDDARLYGRYGDPGKKPTFSQWLDLRAEHQRAQAVEVDSSAAQRGVETIDLFTKDDNE